MKPLDMFVNRFLMVLISLGCSVGMCRADEPPPPPLPELTPKAVAEVIKKIDSDSYEQREQACDELAIAGRPAVKPLMNLALAGRPESGFRSLKVLERLYVRSLQLNDELLALDIEEAFEEISNSPQTALASRLERMFATHSAVNEKIAIRRVKQLGGLISESERLVSPLQLRKTIPLGRNETKKGILVVIGKKWTGGEKGFKHLERIPSLSQLYLVSNAPVGKNAFANLKGRLPFVDIHIRSAARLGVTGGASPWGDPACLISGVAPGSAADKGGIQRGDIVLQFGQHRIQGFEQLVTAIMEHEPGDKVRTIISRRNQRVELTIELQGWTDAPIP